MSACCVGIDPTRETLSDDAANAQKFQHDDGHHGEYDDFDNLIFSKYFSNTDDGHGDGIDVDDQNEYKYDDVSIVPGRTRSYSDAPNEEYEGHESRRNTHLY